MQNEKILILLIIKVNDKGGGVSSKTIEMFSTPFNIEDDYRYFLTEELIKDKYLRKEKSLFFLTENGCFLISKMGLASRLETLRTERSSVTVDYLLRKNNFKN